jgi:hypothetical protein
MLIKLFLSHEIQSLYLEGRPSVEDVLKHNAQRNV